ncbi:MAG: hypothetical protein ACYC3L_11980 [Gemmatimonadaceae bacterium]
MIIALALSLALASDTVTFPTVTSQNLEGKALTLPRDFGGARNVVFVAFLRKQQADVDTWVPFVKQALARHPGNDYYEIPTIRKMVAPMRWMINRGMKGGIDDRSARDRTVTLYIDKAPFKQALGIADENAIQVLVVDRAGQVLWRTTGTFDAEKGEELEAALAGR